MKDRRERKLRKLNWLEKHGNWYNPFIGVLYAGLLLTVLNWGIWIIYELARN